MFDSLELLPPDPILGLIEKYAADNNPNKIDLGVGVYKNEQGDTPVLAAVKQAEQIVHQQQTSKSYIGPAGDPGTNRAVQCLLFGEDHDALKTNRVTTFQTPGGCGALSLAAELVKQANSGATVWVSNPTWGNHLSLLGQAGLKIAQYSYYNNQIHAVDFDAMMANLEQGKSGDILLLHGCCHNPCGADLNHDQWQAVAELASTRGITPLIDIAYQGFGEGINEDAYGIRLLADQLPELLVAASCSKNFGLYRERAGSLSVLTNNAAQGEAAFSQLAHISRCIYSMPPSHGAAIVGTILQDQHLNNQWQAEVAEMRDRINRLRSELVQQLNNKGAAQDFSFITKQHGMFSFLGISADQVRRLADEYSIYMVGSSRISIAGINSRNIDYLTDAIVSIL